MKKTVLTLTLAATMLMVSSCASKKDLQNCQNENRELTTNYQTTKEQLAASPTPTRIILIYQSWLIKSTSRTDISVIWLR